MHAGLFSTTLVSLLQLPAVRKLSENGEADDKDRVELLSIFASGSLADLRAVHERRGGSDDSLFGLDVATCTRVMTMLTLCSICDANLNGADAKAAAVGEDEVGASAGKSEGAAESAGGENASALQAGMVSYDAIARGLGITGASASSSSSSDEGKGEGAEDSSAAAAAYDSEVEEWVIKGITSGLLDARLDDGQRQVYVFKTVQRVFGADGWEALVGKLKTWRSNVKGLLGHLTATVSAQNAQKEKQRALRFAASRQSKQGGGGGSWQKPSGGVGSGTGTYRPPGARSAGGAAAGPAPAGPAMQGPAVPGGANWGQ